MEKQDYKSKWDDLVREIGAEVTPETEQRSQTHAAPVQESVERAPAANLPPLPKKSAVNWANLAGELGLPPIEEETPTTAPEPPARPPRREGARDTSARESTRETRPREGKPRDAESRERPSRGDQEREDQERPPQERGSESRGSRRGRGGRGRGRDDRGGERGGERSGRGGQRGGERGGAERGREGQGQRRDSERSRRDREDAPREQEAERSQERGTRDESQREERSAGRESQRQRRETREPRREPRKQETSDFEDRPIETPMAEIPPVAKEPPKSPAVSLWHKIFGMPSEPTPPVETVEVHEEERASVEFTRDVEREPDSIEVRSLSGDEVSAAGFIEDQPSADLAAAEEDERKRGRTRRRRRGGRGRRGDRPPRDRQPSEPLVHESAGADDLNAGFDDLGADDEDDLSTGELGAPDGDSDLEDLNGDESSTRDSRSMSAAQRAIPSWDDVIGFIVDSNMQTRTQRRPAGRSDSRGSSPRGRSRGGRRNK